MRVKLAINSENHCLNKYVQLCCVKNHWSRFYCSLRNTIASQIIFKAYYMFNTIQCWKSQLHCRVNSCILLKELFIYLTVSLYQFNFILTIKKANITVYLRKQGSYFFSFWDIIYFTLSISIVQILKVEDSTLNL